MGLHPLIPFAVELDKTAHSMKQPPGDGQAKPQASCKTAASGISLIKIITHLYELGICHTDSGIINIYDQIDAIAFAPGLNADINAALLRKLDRVFQKDFEDMGDFFRISYQD